MPDELGTLLCAVPPVLAACVHYSGTAAVCICSAVALHEWVYHIVSEQAVATRAGCSRCSIVDMGKGFLLKTCPCLLSV
jgi:hypothetical protein